MPDSEQKFKPLEVITVDPFGLLECCHCSDALKVNSKLNAYFHHGKYICIDCVIAVIAPSRNY